MFPGVTFTFPPSPSASPLVSIYLLCTGRSMHTHEKLLINTFHSLYLVLSIVYYFGDTWALCRRC